MAKKLPDKVASLEELPEALREYYEENTDGEFELPGLASKGKLDEFRTSNRKLKSQVEKMTQQLEPLKDIDLEKYQRALKLLEAADNDKDKKALQNGNLDEVVERRIAAMRKEYDTKIASLTEQLGKSDSELATERIDNRVQSAIADAGFRPRTPEALKDIKRRAREAWTLDKETRQAVCLDANGEPRYGADGRLSEKEWVKELAESATHLFESGKGGGGGGGEGETTVRGNELRGRDNDLVSKNLDKIAKGEMAWRPGA